MEAPLILADRLMQVIRESGLNKSQASAALEISRSLILAADDLPSTPFPRLPEGAASVEP